MRQTAILVSIIAVISIAVVWWSWQRNLTEDQVVPHMTDAALPAGNSNISESTSAVEPTEAPARETSDIAIVPERLFSVADRDAPGQAVAYVDGMAIVDNFRYLRPSRYEVMHIDRPAIDRFFASSSNSNAQLPDGFNFTIFPETECIVESVRLITEASDGLFKRVEAACVGTNDRGRQSGKLVAALDREDETVVIIVTRGSKEYQLLGIADSDYAIAVEIDPYSKPVLTEGGPVLLP